jgi:hypothetical protein
LPGFRGEWSTLSRDIGSRSATGITVHADRGPAHHAEGNHEAQLRHPADGLVRPAFVVMTTYPLTEKRHKEILADIRDRRERLGTAQVG